MWTESEQETPRRKLPAVTSSVNLRLPKILEAAVRWDVESSSEAGRKMRVLWEKFKERIGGKKKRELSVEETIQKISVLMRPRHRGVTTSWRYQFLIPSMTLGLGKFLESILTLSLGKV